MFVKIKDSIRDLVIEPKFCVGDCVYDNYNQKYTVDIVSIIIDSGSVTYYYTIRSIDNPQFCKKVFESLISGVEDEQ